MGIKQGVKSFSASTALAALNPSFFNEERCREFVFKSLHPHGAHCPRCGVAIEDRLILSNFWEGKRCLCRSCGRWFSTTTGTVLHNTSFDVRQIYAIAFFLGVGLSDAAIAKALKISLGAVRLWRMRFSTTEKEGLE